jgi:hypothetical protein
MRRRTAWLAIATIAVGGALIVATRSTRQAEPTPAPVAGEPRLASDASAPAPKLEAELAGREEPDVGREVAVETKTVEPSSPTATLLVRTVDKQTGKPLSGVRVYGSTKEDDGASSSDDEVESSKGDFAHPPTTDEDGRAELFVPAGADLSIWVHGGRTECESKDMDVPSLRSGEQRDLLFELRTGDDLRVFGRVVDAAGDVPIHGADVRVSRAGFADSDDRRVEILSRVTTGADGRFEVRLPSWKQPFLNVEADGFGVAVARHCEGHDRPELELVFRLSKAATLEVQASDPRGGPVANVRFDLSAEGYSLPLVDESWSGEYVHVPDCHWIGVTGVDGRCSIGGVSSGLGIRIEMYKDGNLLRREPERLVLEPGQVLKREWILGGGCTLNGLAVDQDEKPVASVELWLSKTDPGPGHYFETWSKEAVTTKATTDADGRFVLPDVAPGEWWLGPAPRGQVKSVAPTAMRVDVLSAASQDVTLRVHRGLFIRGKVVDSEGKGVELCNVMALPLASQLGGPQAQTEEDGTFTIGPVAPGRFSVVAEAMNRFPATDKVEANAGDSDVILRLKPGGGIRVRIVDARTGAPRAAEVLLAPQVASEGIFGGGIGFGVNQDGIVDMQGLDPGRYDLAARTEDGCFGVLRNVGVLVGEKGKEIPLSVAPGGRLRMTYAGVLPHVQVDFRLDGVRIDWGQRLQRGTPLEKPAPAGRLTLEIRTDPDTPPRTRVVELQPGEKKDIQFDDGE